jgi:hypothetical protein
VSPMLTFRASTFTTPVDEVCEPSWYEYED